MAKDAEVTKKVTFYKPFEGGLNNNKRIIVTKKDIEGKVKNNIRELPLVVYEWIQKFNVCN